MLKVDRNNIQHVSIGLNIAAGMVVFTCLGFFIDKKVGGVTWTLVGVFLGLFYCGYEVWKLMRELNRQDKGK